MSFGKITCKRRFIHTRKRAKRAFNLFMMRARRPRYILQTNSTLNTQHSTLHSRRVDKTTLTITSVFVGFTVSWTLLPASTFAVAGAIAILTGGGGGVGVGVGVGVVEEDFPLSPPQAVRNVISRVIIAIKNRLVLRFFVPCFVCVGGVKKREARARNFQVFHSSIANWFKRLIGHVMSVCYTYVTHHISSK